MKRVRSILVGVALLFGAGAVFGGEPRLLYSTRNHFTSAVGWDVAGDTALEWVTTESGPSVLRRVNPDGSAGETLIEMRGEAAINALRASIDYLQVPAEGATYSLLPFSSGIRVVKQESGKRGRIIASNSADDEAAGIPRIWIRSISLVGGRLAVVGSHSDPFEAPNFQDLTVTTVFAGDHMVAEIAGHVVGESGGRALLCGPGEAWRALGEAGPAQAVALAAPAKVPGDRWLYKVFDLGGRRFQWQSFPSSEVRVFPLDGRQVQAAGVAGGSAQGEQVLPSGCADGPPWVTGMWQTRRGTIVLAVDSWYSWRQHGSQEHGGVTTCCLFEVQ